MMWPMLAGMLGALAVATGTIALAYLLREDARDDETPLITDGHTIEDRPLDADGIRPERAVDDCRTWSTIDDRPVHDQPVHDRPIHDQPVHDRPIHDQPVHDRPIHDRMAR